MTNRRTYHPLILQNHKNGLSSFPCNHTQYVRQCTFSVSHFVTPLPPVTWSHTFSAKERDTETGYSVTSLRSVSSSSLSQAQTSLAWHSLIRRFGSRYYSSDLSIWLSVDPQSDKYPSFSPYVYCANNPVMLVDPNGEDPIYAKNFWGRVKKIGDDGKCGNSAFLVLGKKAKEVRKATRAGEFYTGDLSPDDHTISIPTGQVLQGVQSTVELMLKSGTSPENRVEYGGHSLFGDNNARIWDPGRATQTTTSDGVTLQVRTLENFKINGKYQIGGPPETVQFIWHVHTLCSSPSEEDYSKMDGWRKGGFIGNTFVVCPNDGKVSFYNERHILTRIRLNEFIQMGKQEDMR